MISWIQRTFQHHFRLIFAVLLIGMVIPFIFTIGSTPGIGRSERTAANREFFGHNLLSSEESRALMSDTQLSAQLQYGAEVTAEQLEYYMFQRVAAKHLADELHVPPPSTDDITGFIKTLRIFAGTDGQFEVSRYDAFRNSLKSSSMFTEADIVRVISDDVRMIKIQRMLAGPGYVMPADVKDILTRGDTSWTISTATTDYAAYDPGINLSESEIAKFLSDNSFRYTVAPRIVVDCVRFPAEMFTAGIAPTDAEIREFYDANPARFPKAPDAKAPAVKADPSAEFAAVKPQVRQAVILEKAKGGAVKAASDLAYALYEGKVARASLDAFLAGRKLKAESLAPFTNEAGPSEFGGSREITSAAFELNTDRFYSEGVPSPTGAVVLIWKDLLPAHNPALAEIREKVRADATDNQKRIRFVEFGRVLRAGIERRLKEGEPFEKAAADAAGSVKVAVKSYTPFTLRAQPRDLDQAAYGALESLEKGSVSEMEVTADKGVIVYAADKKLPVANESNPLYAQTRLQLATTFARTDTTSIMHEVVDAELKRTDKAVK
jgi:peptidyl-prolyl cis-trans isomerase D